MNSESDPNSPEIPKRKSIFPGKLDQGWATLLAGLLALIGTLAVVFYPRGEKPVAATMPTLTMTLSSPLPTATDVPTLTPSPTHLPSPTFTSSPSPTPALSPTQFVVQPTAQLVGQLSPFQAKELQVVGSAAIEMAQVLNLEMKDGFDTNDYGWDESKDFYDQGVQCESALRDSLFHLAVTSTTLSGDGTCYAYAPKTADYFYLSFDAAMNHHRNADILLLFNYTDNENYYRLSFKPQTQKVALWVKINGEFHRIFSDLYVPEINKNGANHITFIALPTEQILSINNTIVADVRNLPQLSGRFILLGVYLDEADQVEELLVDNFELRTDQ